jgi:hypothetical protein
MVSTRVFLLDQLGLRIHLRHPLHEWHGNHLLGSLVDYRLVLDLFQVYFLLFFDDLLLAHVVPVVLSFDELSVVFVNLSLAFGLSVAKVRAEILVDKLLANCDVYLLSWHWLNDV